MKFKLPLLAVRDVEVSKAFYGELFDQEVTLDLGWNVTFSGGFAIQQNFSWLTGIPSECISEKPNNMELYFETDDFDGFLDKLAARCDVEYVHPVRRHDWMQRVVRIYDPDHHIIEIGESMAGLARKLAAGGHGVKEICEMIQHPAAFVEAAISGEID